MFTDLRQKRNNPKKVIIFSQLQKPCFIYKQYQIKSNSISNRIGSNFLCVEILYYNLQIGNIIPSITTRGRGKIPARACKSKKLLSLSGATNKIFKMPSYNTDAYLLVEFICNEDHTFEISELCFQVQEERFSNFTVDWSSMNLFVDILKALSCAEILILG